MKKKFLNLLFAPLLITPIIASSCSDTNNIAAQNFTYDSNKYQLYIVPVAGDDNSYTTANVLIRLKYTEDPNHKDGAQDDQYIGDITINDSYTNKDNGHSYKTNIVSFDVMPNSKVKYATGKTNDIGEQNYYVHYTITGLSVTANEFSFFPFWYGLETTSKSVRPMISVESLNMDVTSFSSNVISVKNVKFSEKLLELESFSHNPLNYTYQYIENLSLPNNLKIIGQYCFDFDIFYQNELVIPQSVEEIGITPFWDVKFTNSSSSSDSNSSQSSTTKKGKIKIPKKFESQETNIFGDNKYYENAYSIEYY